MIRFSLQVVAVMLVSACLSYLADYIGFLSWWNALWIFGLPTGVAIVGNDDVGSRGLAALVLTAASLAAMMGTAAIFALGP